jgi:hypothetical protein
VCIRYRGNVPTAPLPSNDRGIFTEPLPNNDRGIHTQTDGREFFKLGRCDGLRCRDIRTEFHKDLFRQSKVNMGDKHTRGQQRDLISLLCFLK